MNKLIYDYLKKNNDFYPDSTYGDGYRCSVYLNDGTYLPCVMLRKSDPVTQLALQRFKQEKYGKSIFNSITKDGYEKIVKSFVTSGNHVNYYDIAKLEPSRFAVPLSLLKKVEGETTMADRKSVV